MLARITADSPAAHRSPAAPACVSKEVRSTRSACYGMAKKNAMRDHNYQDLVQKVTMYLDNELTESAEVELLREIKTNPAYFEVLSKEQSFREFIKSKIHRRKPSPALIQSIKEKIRIAPA